MAAKRARLERLALQHPRDILTRLKGRTDLLNHRLIAALPNRLRQAQKSLDTVAHKLPMPDGEINRRRSRLELTAQRLYAPLLIHQKDARHRLEALSARLESVSYQSVLARGFALVTTARNTPITMATAIKPGMALQLHFADGTAEAKATTPLKSSQLDLGL